MLIVTANNKGGTGKTLFARLFLSYLASYEQYRGILYAAELDAEQLNFTDFVEVLNQYSSQLWEKFIGTYYEPPQIPVISVDEALHKCAGVGSGNICVCDTPPVVVTASSSVIPLIQSADLLVIPTRGNDTDVQATERIIKLRNKGLLNSTKIIINEYSGIPREEQAINYLKSLNVAVYTFPRSETIKTNFNFRRPWWIGSRNTFRASTQDLIRDLLRI